LVDERRRQRRRGKARRRRGRGGERAASRTGGATAAPGGLPAALAAPVSRRGNADAFGAQSDVVRQALADRDEIERLLNTFNKSDRDRLPDVLPSANALVGKVQSLAATVGELDRNNTAGEAQQVESEITKLEA